MTAACLQQPSFILDNGIPVAGMLKITYPASSPSIVESKSLKLYLGSFHMEALGKTLGQAVDRFVATVAADLSALLCTEVKVHFYEDVPSFLPFDFNDYTLLEKEPDTYALQFSVYQETPPY